MFFKKVNKQEDHNKKSGSDKGLRFNCLIEGKLFTSPDLLKENNLNLKGYY